ncbi:MAG: T9SS type A sorting domain-containing protein [Bacteroidota bacterium]
MKSALAFLLCCWFFTTTAIADQLSPLNPRRVLLFVSHDQTYYTEYIVMKAALEDAGYQVDVRSSVTGAASLYGGEVNDWANKHDLGSSFAEFTEQYEEMFGESWSDANNAQPATIEIEETIQDVASMSNYSALVIAGGVGVMNYRLDGTYEGHGTANADSVQNAAEKLNELALEALAVGKPVLAQCHGASLPVFWRIPGTSGPDDEELGFSLIKGGIATGYPEPATNETLNSLGVTHRPLDRVTITSPHSSFDDDGFGDHKIVTTRDWYPQTVAHAARTLLNLLETYPPHFAIANNETPVRTLILHGGAVDPNDCGVGNPDNDVPCNYGTEASDLPADYTNVVDLLNSDSPHDNYFFAIDNIDITADDLPYNSLDISEYFEQYDVIIYFKHWAEDNPVYVQNAIVDFADNGGTVITMHHGLFNSGTGKDILINELFGAESHLNTWTADILDFNLLATNLGHFITSYGITPELDPVIAPASWQEMPLPPGANDGFSYYQRFEIFDEIYWNLAFNPDVTFGHGMNEIAPLLSNDQPGTQAHITGFTRFFDPSGDNTVGKVICFAPGERKGSINVAHPYGQMIRNSVAWSYLQVDGLTGGIADDEVDEVNLEVTASRTSGAAPLYVFFDATESDGLEEGNDLVNADFSWNFDVEDTDPEGKWEKTKGMVAGHVFELPGNYQVSCRLTAPNGNTYFETIEINVSEFGGTTYYVSNEGNDGNSGLSENSPWRTADFAFEQLSTNQQLLFRRGDTFEKTSMILDNLIGRIHIGAYGEGARPIINSLANPNFTIQRNINIRNSSDVVVENLHIIANQEGVSRNVTASDSEHVLFQNLELEGTRGMASGLSSCNLIGFFNCYYHDFSVIGLYSGDTDRLSFVGNSIDQLDGTPQPEHGVRIQGGEKQFLAHNSLTNLIDTKTAITIRGDGQRHVMIYRNKMDRLLGVNPQNAETLAAINYVTIEGNYIGHNAAYVTHSFPPSTNGINIEATNIAVRNNVIDGYNTAIFVGHDYNGVVSGDVDVYHNTAHWRPVTGFSSSVGRVVRLRDVDNIIVKNNLISADDVSNIEVVNTNASGNNFVFSNNIVTSTPNYVSSPLPNSAAHTNSVINYHITEGSPAQDEGDNTVPVFYDLFGGLRPDNFTKDVGAFEAGTIVPDEENIGAEIELVEDSEEEEENEGDESEEVLGLDTSGLIITAHPLPASREIRIQSVDDTTIGQLAMYDLLGRIVHTRIVSSLEYTLDVRSLANGTYLLKAKNETIKIVVMH